MGTTLKKLNKRQHDHIMAQMAAAHSNFEKKLKLHAIYKTHDQELSQDLVQTTFLKTMLYLQKGGKIETMRSFLNHVLRGLIIDEYRKQKTTSLDTMLNNGYDPAEDNFEQLINILDGKEIVGLINLLPPKYQTVVEMRYLQNLSLTEMSSLTGEKQNTISVQAHRGLTLLKELYEKTHA